MGDACDAGFGGGVALGLGAGAGVAIGAAATTLAGDRGAGDVVGLVSVTAVDGITEVTLRVAEARSFWVSALTLASVLLTQSAPGSDLTNAMASTTTSSTHSGAISLVKCERDRRAGAAFGLRRRGVAALVFLLGI